jgi:hypothetical protein
VQFTIPTNVDYIDNLIGELSIIVKKYGSESPEVTNFIEKNKGVTFIDVQSKMMHTFNELAYGLALIIGGISIENRPDPADWWKK